MIRVLGFDISSSCIGICLLEIDEQNKITMKYLDNIKPVKSENIIERIADTRDKVKKLIEHLKPNYIAIEDLVQYLPGKSSANTIITLTTFNRMIGLLAFDFLQQMPNLYNVMSIRHGLKKDKILPPKEEMPALVSSHLNVKFPYRIGRKGKTLPENYDMADAWAVALYHAFILTGKIIKKAKVKKKKVK